MGNKKKKKGGSSNFCWLVKNLKDAIKSAFRSVPRGRMRCCAQSGCLRQLLPLPLSALLLEFHIKGLGSWEDW